MIEKSIESDINQEYASLKREYNALSRKFARLGKEYDNLTQLYKQAVALRDYNEQEKETQIRYNQMLRDYCPDDMFLLDAEMQILLYTSSVKAYFNENEDIVERKDFLSLLREVFDALFVDRIKSAILKVKSTKTPFYYEMEALKKREKLLYFSVSVAPALDDNDDITGIVVLLHDASDLYTANMQAQLATKAKSTFLSNMSHEMRTPMNAIIGMTNIAKTTEDPVKKEYCLDKIGSASKHLLGLINDILDMSKIEANKFELSYDEFDFEKMLINITDVINFNLEAKNQTFIINLDKNIPSSIIGDELRLVQVITNLLTNAVKFTPEGGTIQLNIKLLSHCDRESTIQIEVIDTGIGISEEQQSRLFTSFEQADSGITRKYGGTGLGLAISKRIVELMGGKIWIESELNKGSKFIFTIKVEEGSLRSRPKLMANKDEIRILIVDDSPEIRSYFLHVMAALELSCDVAKSGSEALSMTENSKGKKPYSIFFIDWQMPEMNGIELARKIKEITDHNGIIIMISAAEWSDIEQEALAVGVNSFVSKPLLPSTLINRINECLGYKDALVLRNQPTRKNYNFKNHTLLIAEDVDVNREIIAAVLENTGVCIDFAEDGLEAVALFSKNPNKYSLILMDIHMPKMDGYDATRKIRSLNCPEAHSVPIIAMTANVFREDIENCIEAGMNEHIGKPIDTQMLFKKLAYYLQPKPGSQTKKIDPVKNESTVSDLEYEYFLPVIDVLDGLGRVMNNKKLYFTLVNNFLSAGMANELIRSIKDGDFIKTQRAAHALKGVSANLGFTEVNTLVSRIETEAKMAIESTEHIAELEIAIDNLNRLIKKLLETHLI